MIATYLKTDLERLCDGDPDEAAFDEHAVYDIGDDARKAEAENRAWDEGLAEWERAE